MAKKRNYSAAFKAEVALLLISEKMSSAQVCKQYRLKDTMVSRWKREFLEKAPSVFESSEQRLSQEQQKIADLERMIGKLTMELDLSKKPLNS